MVERGGLENRCALAGTVGSNPTPSATAVGSLSFGAPAFAVGGGVRTGSCLFATLGQSVFCDAIQVACRPSYIPVESASPAHHRTRSTRRFPNEACQKGGAPIARAIRYMAIPLGS